MINIAIEWAGKMQSDICDIISNENITLNAFAILPKFVFYLYFYKDCIHFR